MQKLVLIHGWDYKHYSSMTPSKDVWDNRRKLVDGLQKLFDIKIITLPGFCGEREPNSPWKLEDFADFVEQKLQKDNFNPDYILGYSFGGAVALTHKLKYNKNKIILVSPAISRKYRPESAAHNKLKYFINVLPCKLKELVKDQYISKVLKNPFYAKGTNFLKKTYLNIVGIDMSAELKKLSTDDFKIIFGEKDTATPPQILLDKIPNIDKNIVILRDGTHDIANTNTNELINEIVKFTNTNNNFTQSIRQHSYEI
ncbi:MAG: alpha/beta hydrolase [Alphaproteobacteria bacterium]|nr:alpha/beta hydrolase [Alphaproteobacteria bacterium]